MPYCVEGEHVFTKKLYLLSLEHIYVLKGTVSKICLVDVVLLFNLTDLEVFLSHSITTSVRVSIIYSVL